MNDDDLLQLWSFCDGQIIRLVAPDFTFCVVNESEPSENNRLSVRDDSRLPGDFRWHYLDASKFWKRIA